MDAINLLFVEKYPDYMVYIDLCPKKFARPSFMIELVTTDQSPVNCKTVQETVYVTITCFDTTDDYHRSSTANLLVVQQGVLDLFRSGYMAVDDRKIAVKASSGGRDFDKAYVDLQFEYFEDRSDAPGTTPLMQEVHTTVKEE